MILTEQDAALFYRAWDALLVWVNERRQVVPPFPPPTPGHPIAPALVAKIRDVLWADDRLREQFLAEDAASLGAAERALIGSWKHRVRGQFVIYSHMKKQSIFMSDAVYGVRGIFTPLEVMFPSLPIFVEAVLLPFQDVIITDGLLTTPPMQMTFGGGIRRMFKNQYSTARDARQIRTQLPWIAGAEDPLVPVRSSPARRATRRTRTPR